MTAERSAGFRQYFLNIAWSWLGVAALFLSGAVVTPLLIRRLGTERFGIWALALSLVEYVWMIDLGLRPATVKLSAEMLASGRKHDLNQMLSTALAYSSLAGVLLLLLAWPGAGHIGTLLRIEDPQFAFLVRMVSLSWAFGLIFNIFAAMMEGFQRFDYTNRISIVQTLARSGLSLVLVLSGGGLREMGIALVSTQGVSYLMMYFAARRVYPELHVSPALVSRAMARELIGMARQIVGALIGSRLTQALLPSMVAYWLGARYVTYFTQTQRIYEYSADIISRVGLVSAPRAADLLARGRVSDIVDLTLNANRYCLALWGALGSFLFVYGGRFCSLWVNEEFGRQAEVLLPLFGLGYMFFLSQFVTSAVMMGTGRYQRYSFGMLAESALTIGAFALVLRWSSLGWAVAAFSLILTLNRCVFLSWLYADEFQVSQRDLLWNTMRAPFALIAASSGLLLLNRQFWIPARTWPQLLAAGALHGCIYTVAAWFLILLPEHRAYVLAKVRGALARVR